MTSLIETLNLFGERCAGLAWPMLWQSSILIALLWVLDFTLRRRVRTTLIYALWMLLLVKLILPPSLAVPSGIAYWLVTPGDPPPALDSSSQSPATSFQAHPQSFHRSGYLFLISLGGSLILLGQVLRRSQRVRRIMSSSTEASADLQRLLKDCARAIGLRRSVQLRISAQVVSPAVCGLWRTVILLPSRLPERLTTDQLRAVLWHELVHVKRADLWVDCGQTFLQAVYWWHPLLWTANARIRRVREHAVDERVMAEMRDEDETYPETLLEVARICVTKAAPNLGWLGITESRSRLRERIKRLLEAPVPQFAKLGWRGLVVVTLAGALVLPMACRRKEKSETGASPSKGANPARQGLPRNLVTSVAFPARLLSSPWFGDAVLGQPIGSIGPPHPIRDARDATARAIQIANHLAHEDYSVTPFKEDKVRAIFDGRQWSWHRIVSFGRNDLEAEVRMTPDGKIEEANVRLLTFELQRN